MTLLNLICSSEFWIRSLIAEREVLFLIIGAQFFLEMTRVGTRI